MRRMLSVLSGWALAVGATELAAQASVRGAVFDSLRPAVPLAGVEVVLVGTGLRTRTDRTGRFTFADAPANARTVAHWAPWLDSLALPPLTGAIVRDGSGLDAVLATPSRATFQRIKCGLELDPQEGVLLGDARDANGEPIAGATVVARWHELRVGRGQLVEREVATVDTTTASGEFALCGVPVGSAIRLRAIRGAARSGEREIQVATDVQRHDLVLGDGRVRGSAKGLVVRPNGDAIVGATIALASDTTRRVVSGADGSFELRDLDLRSDAVTVRTLGHHPVTAAVDLVAGQLRVGTVTMEPVSPQLAPVVVSESPFERERREFEVRRRGAIGHFITDDMLRNLPDINANNVAAMVPGLRAIATRGRRPLLVFQQNLGFCHPRFYIDGLLEGVLDREREGEQWSALQRAKRIEVYTPGLAPPRYTDMKGCGAVVIWTK